MNNELKQLVKNTSQLALTRLFQFLTGLIRIKLIAHYLGTLGTGLVNQLTFVTQKMSQFTLLSMSEAVVKQISENKNSPSSVQIISSVYKGYFILIALFMFISFIVLNIFSESLTVYVFGDVSFLKYFYVGLFSFPVLILDSIPFSILKAFKDVKRIAIARIIIVIINLVTAVPLILIFGIEGAIAFVTLSYIVSLSVNFFFARKYYFKELGITMQSILKAQIQMKFVKELFVFSLAGIFVGTFAIVSELLCRSFVVSDLGVSSIGIYSPNIMFSSIVTGFILPSFSTYLYPRFCEVKEKREISELINSALRLGTFVILPLLMLGIPFKSIFISIFYSSEFLQAAKYLPFHLIGVTFYVWWYVFSQAMTPTGRIKQHGVFQIIFYSTDILVTYIFVAQYGLYGWMLKHIVSPFIFFWIYLLYAKKYMGLKMQRINIVLMIYLLFASTILIAVDLWLVNSTWVNFILGPILLVLVLLFLNKEEQEFLRSKLNFKRK